MPWNSQPEASAYLPPAGQETLCLIWKRMASRQSFDVTKPKRISVLKDEIARLTGGTLNVPLNNVCPGVLFMSMPSPGFDRACHRDTRDLILSQCMRLQTSRQTENVIAAYFAPMCSACSTWFQCSLHSCSRRRPHPNRPQPL